MLNNKRLEEIYFTLLKQLKEEDKSMSNNKWLNETKYFFLTTNGDF